MKKIIGILFFFATLSVAYGQLDSVTTGSRVILVNSSGGFYSAPYPSPAQAIPIPDTNQSVLHTTVPDTLHEVYWKLTGNTPDSLSFLGTLNAQDLIFKTNNNQVACLSKTDGSLLIGSSIGYSTRGIDSKIVFDRSHHILRMGSTTGTEWNLSPDDSNSVMIGFGTTFSPCGNCGVLVTFKAPIAKNNSTAIGPGTSATGAYSTSIGVSGIATGQQSFSFGSADTASGQYSFALGRGSSASGDYSLTLGTYAKALGYGSIALGNFTSASSTFETSLGVFNTDYVPTRMATPSRLFTIGNGISSSKADAFMILGNGNTGIGISRFENDPDADTVKLKVSGRVTIAKFQSNTGTSVGIMPNVSGGIVVSSDKKFKQNIAPISSNESAKILDLKPVSYDIVSDNEGGVSNVGLIAQDVEKTFPSLVVTNMDGSKAVAYTGMIPLLIKIIQDQESRIKELEAKVK